MTKNIKKLESRLREVMEDAADYAEYLGMVTNLGTGDGEYKQVSVSEVLRGLLEQKLKVELKMVYHPNTHPPDEYMPSIGIHPRRPRDERVAMHTCGTWEDCGLEVTVDSSVLTLHSGVVYYANVVVPMLVEC